MKQNFIMEISVSSTKKLIYYSLTLVLPPIKGELESDQLIHMHLLMCANTAYIISNLGGGLNGHLVTIITTHEYYARTGQEFPPIHNLGNFTPPIPPWATVE